MCGSFGVCMVSPMALFMVGRVGLLDVVVVRRWSAGCGVLANGVVGGNDVWDGDAVWVVLFGMKFVADCLVGFGDGKVGGVSVVGEVVTGIIIRAGHLVGWTCCRRRLPWLWKRIRLRYRSLLGETVGGIGSG